MYVLDLINNNQSLTVLRPFGRHQCVVDYPVQSDQRNLLAVDQQKLVEAGQLKMIADTVLVAVTEQKRVMLNQRN